MKKSTLVLTVLFLSHYFSYGQETLSQQKYERLFQTGLELLSHHEYGSSYKTFEDYLRIYPLSDSRKADAEYYRAFCALNLYHVQGEKLLEDYIASYPRYPKAIAAYFNLANFFYAEKDYSKAARYYSIVDFLSLSGEQQNTGRFRWGYCLFSQKNLKEALDQFNAIKGLGGQYGPAASYYAGFIESSTGDYPNALIDLKRAETNNSYASIVPVMIANVYYKQKDDAELLKYSEVVLARENTSSADEISYLRRRRTSENRTIKMRWRFIRSISPIMKRMQTRVCFTGQVFPHLHPAAMNKHFLILNQLLPTEILSACMPPML